MCSCPLFSIGLSLFIGLASPAWAGLSAKGGSSAGGGNPSAPRQCGNPLKEDQAFIESEYKKAQAKIGLESPDLKKCLDYATALNKKCHDVEKDDKDCKERMGGILKALDTKSMSGQSNRLIETSTKFANCQRKIGFCYTDGSENGQAEAEAILKKCYSEARRQAETNQKIPNAAAADRAIEYGAIKEFTQALYWRGKSIRDCYEAEGKKTEEEAQKRWLESAGLKTEEQFKKEKFFCFTGDTGIRICRFDETGKQNFRESAFEDANPDKAGTNPVRLFDPKTQRSQCSGSLLGDGQTVVTAGHCFGSEGTQRTGETREILVHDKDGVGHYVQATCNTDYQTTTTLDSGVCKLATPVPANPVYFAAHDPAIKGKECQTEGYVMRCPTSFFSGLNNQPAYTLGYPAQYRLTRSDGVLTFDPRTNNLTYNMPITGGNSGGGVYVNYGGRLIQVSTATFGNRFQAALPDGAGGPLISIDTLNRLRVQSVTENKLINSQIFFANMVNQ
ncbi:MAG: serine protease [Bdellovibrionales bacterium]